jgi:hypothetical protein
MRQKCNHRPILWQVIRKRILRRLKWQSHTSIRLTDATSPTFDQALNRLMILFTVTTYCIEYWSFCRISRVCLVKQSGHHVNGLCLFKKITEFVVGYLSAPSLD